MPTTQVNISTEGLRETVVVRASVRLKEDWLERLRTKCDVDRLLTEVALKQKCHGVEVVFDGGIRHLVGCACGVNCAREELIQRKKTLESSKGDIDEKLASRENGKSCKDMDAASDGDAGKCYYSEQGIMDDVRQPAHSQGTGKKNSQQTNEQDSCGKNSPNGKGFKDRNDGVTKCPAKEDAKIRDKEQKDEISKVKIIANKKKNAAATTTTTTAAATTTTTATTAATATAAATTATAACPSATNSWTQKQNSTQLKQQEYPPKASAGERGFSDVDSSSCDVHQTSADSEEQRDRICALRMLLNVAVNHQVYYFLFRKLNTELSSICQRCSVFEAFEDGGCHRVAIEPRPGQDLDSIVSDLEGLCRQVSEQVVPFPADVCFDGLEDNIRATTSYTEKVDLYFNNDVKICQMIGKQKDIDELTKEINKLMDANKGERFKASPGTQVKGRFNSTEPPPFSPPSPAGSPIFTILSYDQCNMELLINSPEPIALDVICGDLTTFCKADVLVTFVDHDLKPSGQFAKTLASQFHPSLAQELVRIRAARAAPLPTGNLVHTSAQGLGEVKRLIHVVPPTECEYPSNNPNTGNVLQTVFANCIGYSNDVMNANSLCIPAVGSGIYPCSLVANCFVYALLQFHQSIINGSRIQRLRRIQLVNKDTRQMAEFIDAMHRRLSNM